MATRGTIQRTALMKRTLELDDRKGPTVYEVSKLINKMSDEHFSRFMGNPLSKRLEIIRKLTRKGELWKKVRPK